MNRRSLFERQLSRQIGEAGRCRIRSGAPLEKPVQIEIHPYSCEQKIPCTNNCVWCTRGNDRDNLLAENARGICPDRLVAFIASLRDADIPEFSLAGNSTEPLLYPRIEEVMRTIKRSGSGCRLYSNFQYGDRIFDVACLLDERDLIRISLDAGSPESYNATHCPADSGSFERILANLETFLILRAKAGTDFTVVITYLINQLNACSEEITFIMRWAAEHDVDAVRFVRPLAPYGEMDFRPLSESDLARVSSVIVENAGQLGGRTDFRLNSASDIESGKTFSCCHYWKASAVLGSRGVFFPCTSTAVGEYLASFGRHDLHHPGFDFWEFWRDPRKWDGLDIGTCPECTRGEFCLNEWVEGESAMAAVA